MRIVQAADGTWTVVRADGSTITGFASASEASAATDGLVASAGPATVVETSDPEVITAAITATAVEVPARPPDDWFENPNFTDETTAPDPEMPGVRGCPITITDDGRVYGHIALFKTPHRGIKDANVYAPRSAANYSTFRYGKVVTASGKTIPTGPLTVGTNHAPLHMGTQEAIDYYANTGAAVADVAAGEDQYGIWVAGTIRPGASVAQVEALRRSPQSGDWRVENGQHELAASLAVNDPGFGVPNFALAASRVQPLMSTTLDGEPFALVAAGAASLARIQASPWMTAVEPLLQRLEVVEKWMANSDPAIRPLAASAARERLTAALGDGS